MDFSNITIGQIVVAITSIGVICGFLFKIFSAFHQINENKEKIETLEKKIALQKDRGDKQKEEILAKVDQTNEAVNLLCNAISAIIDNELNDNKNIDALVSAKKQLDGKKAIV